MSSKATVTIDLATGEVRLGGLLVRLVPARGATGYHLESTSGPVIRPLGFGERSRLLRGLRLEDVAAAVARAALVAPGPAPEELRVAVSMALAGGAEKAPSFDTCEALAARRAGWEGRRLREAPALVVDQLCGDGEAEVRTDEWRRFVIDEPRQELGTLIAQMAANLYDRAENTVSAPTVSATVGAETGPSGSPGTTPRAERRRAPGPDADRPNRPFGAAVRAAEPHESRGVLPRTDGRSTTLSPRETAGVVRDERTPPARLQPPAARVIGGTHSRGPEGAPTASPTKAASQIRLASRDTSVTETAVTPSARIQRPASTGRSAWPPGRAGEPVRDEGWSSAMRSSVARTAPSPGVSAVPASREPAMRLPQAVPRAEPPPFADWLDELSILLEAECDLRGLER